jgi:tripartite-type tricarboxylate transporter receptor subunit TctC
MNGQLFAPARRWKPPSRKSLQLAVVAATLTVSGVALGQTYPIRPITMVIPFPAGGPTDLIGRIIGDGIRDLLGQPVILENIAGANGSIGSGRVARSAHDGYTVGIGSWNTHVANGATYALSYDVAADFEPVALLPSYPFFVVASNTVPADDLRGLVEWLKANPDKASQGTLGIGSPGHAAGLLFQKQTGTRYQFVPYRGVAPAMQELVARQIELMFDGPVNSLPQVRDHRIKAYAVMAKSRAMVAPEIPTVDEAGLPGFYFSTWYGLWVPKATPREIVMKLNDAVVRTLTAPPTRQRLFDQGLEIPADGQLTPEALRSFQKAEIEKWWPLLKAANVKAE